MTIRDHGRQLARRLVPFDLRLGVRAVLRLPPRVAWFYVRAHRLAKRRGDAFSLTAPMRPRDLSALLKAAKGRRHVVELGTGTGWTTIALAMADGRRRVISYDPVVHRDVGAYVSLAGPETGQRLDFRNWPAEHGPEAGDPPVELLFIDIGGHSRQDTVSAFCAWEDACDRNGVVAFHDYGGHFPGVPMAIAQLGIPGRVVGESLFVWRVADGRSSQAALRPASDM